MNDLPSVSCGDRDRNRTDRDARARYLRFEDDLGTSTGYVCRGCDHGAAATLRFSRYAPEPLDLS